MSGARRAERPVRQLSFQQPALRRQQVRRQRSVDDEKSLQVYANPLTRGKHGTNSKAASERPNVRVAWAETGKKSLEQVEVVARQIPGRSRPTTGRSSRKFISSNEKATILYSRQELAERLRLAWKHREENKANIDIFLAHATVEERCDSQLSSNATAPSTPSLEKRNPSSNEINVARERSGEKLCASGKAKPIASNVPNKASKHNDEVHIEDFIEKTRLIEARLFNRKEEEEEEENLRSSKFSHEEKTLENCGNKESERSACEEKSKIEMENTVNEENQVDNKKTRINVDCTSVLKVNDESSKIFTSIKSESTPPIITCTPKSKDDFISARQKRASFQSGTNKAFLNPVVERNAPLRAFSNPRGGSAIERTGQPRVGQIRVNVPAERSGRTLRTPTELQNDSSRARRTNSAPPQRRREISGHRVQMNIVIDASSVSSTLEKVTVDNSNEKLEANKDIVHGKVDGPQVKVTPNRPIRSAPLKRRSKSAKRRSFTSSGKDDEDERFKKNNGRGKGALESKITDVVTMVSLVSSTDSESENENSPVDDKLISELRSKLPTTSIIKASTICSHSGSGNVTRRPLKSVSFHKDSIDEEFPVCREPQEVPREEKATVVSQQQACCAPLNIVRGTGSEDEKWRTETPPIAFPILFATLIQRDSEDVGSDAPLTDREKRCLAVPIGDVREKKRKMIKTRAATPTLRSATSTECERAQRSSSVPRCAPLNFPVFSVLQNTLRILLISRRLPEMQIVTMEMKEQRVMQPANNARTLSAPHSILIAESSQLKVEHTSAVATKEAEPEASTVPTEPQFQTTKEKECWHLYRRMCDKGVYVSFDTVLRGMLTPTEYRLRQKELAQDL